MEIVKYGGMSDQKENRLSDSERNTGYGKSPSSRGIGDADEAIICH